MVLFCRQPGPQFKTEEGLKAMSMAKVFSIDAIVAIGGMVL